jgi:succinate dehydrogenase hydrophobic anchor subunit
VLTKSFLFLSLSIVAAVGLVLSVTAHIAAYAGFAVPWASAPLLLGIFAVWVPAMLASNRLVKDYARKDFWKAALRGCPPWMRYMNNGFLW